MASYFIHIFNWWKLLLCIILFTNGPYVDHGNLTLGFNNRYRYVYNASVNIYRGSWDQFTIRKSCAYLSSIHPVTIVILITTIVKTTPINAPVFNDVPSIILLYPVRTLPVPWVPLYFNHSAIHWIGMLSFFHWTYRWYTAKRALPAMVSHGR